jgi:predicted permease
MALSGDLRFAARTLGRSPGLVVAAVLCLGLGIGATTAIFSVVNSVVLRPLPYRNAEELVRLYTEFPEFPNGGLRRFWTSPPEFLDLRRDLSRNWAAIEAWTTGGVNLAGQGEPVRVTASFVSGGMLETLGIAPVRGRLFSPDDDSPASPQTAVIGYDLWRTELGGTDGVVGADILVNGQKTRIVGVMPPGFQFPPGEVDAPRIWLPLRIDPANPGGRGSHFLYLLGRLRDGSGIERGRQEMAALVAESGGRAAPNTHLFHPKFHPLVAYPLHDETIGGVRPAMLMMLGAVFFVLLIACGNVANLLLARTQARHREIAIRQAIGAGTATLVKQFLLEGLLLAVAGVVVGLGLAWAGLRLILAYGADSIPRSVEVGLDGRVLLFTVLVSFATALVFGLAPLAQVWAGRVAETLKAGGTRTTATREAHWLRQAMVVGELALALVLLIGAGLMVRGFWRLQQVDIGLRTEGLVTLRIALPQAAYPRGEEVVQFWTRLQERVRALPGVESATMMAGMPPIRPLNANDTQIEGWVQREGGPIQNIDYYQAVGETFFETVGARLVEGRLFDSRDGTGGVPTVIVNQTMARTYYPGESAIGRRIRPSFQDAWRTIVGVVGDVKNAGADQPTGTEIFLPQAQSAGFGGRNAYLVIRTRGEPGPVVASARREVAAIDPALPVASVRTMEEVLSQSRARPRFLTLLLALFSGVALALAAIGTYGVMSYAVAQRTGEFGIRQALGALPADVLRLVLRQGLVLGVAGALIGAAGAGFLTRFLGGLLFGIDRLDAATFAAMAGFLVLVILLACYFPARRATRVDPQVALHYE